MINHQSRRAAGISAPRWFGGSPTSRAQELSDAHHGSVHGRERGRSLSASANPNLTLISAASAARRFKLREPFSRREPRLPVRCVAGSRAPLFRSSRLGGAFVGRATLGE